MSKISELSDGGSLVSTDYLIAVRSGGNVKVRMDEINVDQVDLGDNEFIRLGNSQDLTIVHNASNSIINQAGIGDLLIQKAGSTKLTVNSTGIDVTGGLTVETASVVAPSTSATFAVNVSGGTSLTSTISQRAKSSNGANAETSMVVTGSAGEAISSWDFKADTTNGALTKIMTLDGNGDISFYEDTGTTPKFFWDASAESLGIGTSSPSSVLTAISGASADETVLTVGNDYSTADAAGDASGLMFQLYRSYASSLNDAAFIKAEKEQAWDAAGDRYSALTFGTRSGATEPTERMRIDSSGLVGIGTDSPATVLSIHDSADKAVFTQTNVSNSQKLEIGNAYSLYTGANGSHSAIASDSVLAFATADAEAMRIDASGNLLVGKTTTAFATQGAVINNNGSAEVTKDGGATLFLNRLNSDGEIVAFYKDGTTVGSIGTVGGRLTTGSGDTGLAFEDTNNRIIPHNISTNAFRDAAIDLGYSSGRFKDIHLSQYVIAHQGAFLGGNASANHLDEYEEGTFTASLRGDTAEPATLVTTTGYYTKIGRTFNYNISFENKDTTGYSGDVSVSGLPFANDFGRHTAAAGVYSLASWSESVIGVSNSGNTNIDLMDIRSANSWAFAQHSAGTTRYLWLSGTYMTTD